MAVAIAATLWGQSNAAARSKSSTFFTVLMLSKNKQLTLRRITRPEQPTEET
jgi:hypothetical protein